MEKLTVGTALEMYAAAVNAFGKMLSKHGIEAKFDVMQKENYRGEVYFEATSLPINEIGLFKFGMKKVVIKTTLMLENDDVAGYVVRFGRITYQYEHASGGSNGCDMEIPEFNFQHPAGFEANYVLYRVVTGRFILSQNLVEYTKKKIKEYNESKEEKQ